MELYLLSRNPLKLPLKNTPHQDRLALYRSSIGTLTVPAQEDLTQIYALKAQYPGVHTFKTVFKECPTEILFASSDRRPELHLTLKSELQLDDPKLGLYPPEIATFDLISMEAGVFKDTEELLESIESAGTIFDYHQDEPEPIKARTYYSPDHSAVKNVRPFRVSAKYTRLEVLETVLKTTRVLRLTSRAISYDDLATVARVCVDLQYFGAIVAPSPAGDKRDEQIALQKIIEDFGRCPDLHHLGLYILANNYRATNSGFPQLQKVRWRSLKRFEYFVCPNGVVCNQFGDHQKPWTASEYASASPNESLKEVALLFDRSAVVANPSAFVAAMAEVFPIDVKIAWTLGDPDWSGGEDSDDYGQYYALEAFVIWAREIWERICEERAGKQAGNDKDESRSGQYHNHKGY